MSDHLSPQLRSQHMGRIKAKNTRPELAVRRYLHAQGLRYRLHDRSLPGRPDMVFAGAKVVLFVNGCFWHRHEGCRFAYTPKSNTEFWLNKFEQNVARDIGQRHELERLGWMPIVIWECEVGTSAVAGIAQMLVTRYRARGRYAGRTGGRA